MEDGRNVRGRLMRGNGSYGERNELRTREVPAIRVDSVMS